MYNGIMPSSPSLSNDLLSQHPEESKMEVNSIAALESCAKSIEGRIVEESRGGAIGLKNRVSNLNPEMPVFSESSKTEKVIRSEEISSPLHALSPPSKTGPKVYARNLHRGMVYDVVCEGKEYGDMSLSDYTKKFGNCPIKIGYNRVSNLFF